jgi:hypothetical protein
MSSVTDRKFYSKSEHSWMRQDGNEHADGIYHPATSDETRDAADICGAVSGSYLLSRPSGQAASTAMHNSLSSHSGI